MCVVKELNISSNLALSHAGCVTLATRELSSLTFKVDHTFLDGCEIGDRVQGAEEVSSGSLFFPESDMCEHKITWVQSTPVSWCAAHG